jgi:hypothetical protein
MPWAPAVPRRKSCPRPLVIPERRSVFTDTGPGDGVDVAWLVRTIRSVAPLNVEDGQRIEIARMQQLLAERD